MTLIYISASSRVRRNAYYTKEKMLLAQFISEKKSIENNYRCDRSKLKAIENKKCRCDKINLEVCLVMETVPSPQGNS